MLHLRMWVRSDAVISYLPNFILKISNAEDPYLGPLAFLTMHPVFCLAVATDPNQANNVLPIQRLGIFAYQLRRLAQPSALDMSMSERLKKRT